MSQIKTHDFLTLSLHARSILGPKQKKIMYKKLLMYFEEVLQNLKYNHIQRIPISQDQEHESSNKFLISKQFPQIEQEDIKNFLQGINFQLPQPRLLIQTTMSKSIKVYEIPNSQKGSTLQKGQCPLFDDAFSQELNDEMINSQTIIRPSSILPNIQIIEQKKVKNSKKKRIMFA